MFLSNRCMQPINSLPMLIYDIFFFIFLIPFIVCGLYYANNQGFVCLNATFPGMDVEFYRWLRVDSWILLGLAVGCIWTVFQFCCCIATYCSYVVWAVGNVLYILWRLAWLIVGSVLFWKHIYPNGLCGEALNNYMWANLIIGYIHILFAILFLIIYRPEPLVIDPAPVPTFTQPVMMTTQRLPFQGTGVVVGGTGHTLY